MPRKPAALAVFMAGVVLFATFGVARAAEPGTQGYFIDDNGHLFEEDIDAIAAAGITKGCNPPSNTRYCPDFVVDRGAMAAFLRRALDLPAASRDYFTDDSNSIFENDINAIAEAGITTGYADGTFGPNDPVSRGQMATFLTRALHLPPGPEPAFADVARSAHADAIAAVAAAGIASGYTDGTFRPRAPVTRAQMATFFVRALDL